MSRTTPSPSLALVPQVDLVFDADCPHADEARELLRRAMLAAGLPPTWREWTRDSVDTPPSFRGLGSPTILVDGIDVSTDDAPATGDTLANSCRIYQDNGRLRGVPPLGAVTQALEPEEFANQANRLLGSR